ncbi:hypothetical protein BDP27DRAFT_1047363 [Rhodocollybia butyracea]|uniref:Uncharacterized protein n=1 Tax=Rhodocollybia butyracea TaxID=206335 RepID=A0A9P5U400_9AGAR|nr:hypothetical protein BDP27DRAFT_1047363 [Rhodocollybia butyracea]
MGNCLLGSVGVSIDLHAQRNCVSVFCTEPPETPLRVAPWQYVLTAICIAGAAMVSTCLLVNSYS